MAQGTPLHPHTIVVAESSNLDSANDSGEVVIEPGQERPIVEFRPGNDQAFKLLAVGATDQQDCRYVLRSGSTIIATTESPLGSVNEPFSFVREYGSALQIGRYVTYSVMNMGDSEKSFVGRVHCEVPQQ